MASVFTWQEEIGGTKLPDGRYSKNLRLMCERLETGAGLSFSTACGAAVRKSAHRLFSEEELDVLSGHSAQTVKRARDHRIVLALEDTTDLNYHSHIYTEGLGDLGGQKSTFGLSAHTLLLVSLIGEPLGILGQHIWAPVNETRKSPLLKRLPIEEKESMKWLHAMDWSNTQLADFEGQVILVGDREGDFYEHFSAPRLRQVSMVIRLLHTHRNLIFNGQKTPVHEVLPQLTFDGDKSIEIAARKGKQARQATLSVFHGAVTMPASLNRTGAAIELSMVWCVELSPPLGEKPLDWIILTTLDVNDFADAQFILDIYTKRWIIERFHYVLKQGLRVEKLQFDNFARLTNAIKVCSMVAWRLLWIAYLSKTVPNESFEKYFDEKDKEILEKTTNTAIQSVKDHITALGKLVNFVPTQKQSFPGEKLLWQAIQIFDAMKKGFLLAQFYGTG